VSDDTGAIVPGNLPSPDSVGLDPVPGDWQRVSSNYIAVQLICVVISAVLFTGGASVAVLVTGLPWLVVPPAALLLLHVLLFAFTPRRVRALGYRLRQDDLVFCRGIMFFRVVAVPYGRMQLVDITRGPLARAFGLSELKLVTAAASSRITIPGLPSSEADALRDRLVELAESRRAGL
jgi:membrane protein YdbS with pleckstrin-like domain